MKTIQTLCSLFFLLCFFTQPTTAQNAVIDSLKHELSIHPERDSTRVRILNAYAYKHYRIDQKKLEKFADESIELASEIEFYDGDARAWYLNSIFNLAKGDIENVSKAIKKSLVLYEKAENLIRVSS